MTAAQQPPVNSAHRFAHIDAMRALAVLLVVVAHAGLEFVVPGGSGVTIFFSISGFIITFLLLRERDRTRGFSIKGFYFRRTLKIGPPFLLLIVLPTVAYAAFAPVRLDRVLPQVFFVYDWVYYKDPGGVLPGTSVLWSLAIEEQFYIVFAILWFTIVRSSRWGIALAVTAICAIAYGTIARFVMAAAGVGAEPRIYYGSDTRLDGIAWGVLTALFTYELLARPEWMPKARTALGRDLVLISAIGLYLLSLVVRDEWFRNTIRYTLQSVSACLVIVYGLLPGGGRLRSVFYRIALWKPVALTGLASYSIYLVHLPLMVVWHRYGPHLALGLQVALYSAGGLLAGMIAYELIEVPAQRLGHGHRFRSWRWAARE
jgi:peptidoglycan/LPS O-acetylase OafA/YrhL